MLNLTIVIKTFNRKNSLIRLLTSIEKYYSSTPIIVVDDSKKSYKYLIEKRFRNINLNYITVTFDVGLSKGRNILLDHIKTKYFVLCDDDFEFDIRTKLETAVELITTKDVDIVGGTIYNVFRLNSLYSFLWALKKPKRFVDLIKANEIISVYNGTFKIKNNNVELTIDQKYINYLDKDAYKTDIVSNFFIANTEKVRSIQGWQPEEVKVGEHEAFFLRLKLRGIRVMYTPLFGIKHYPKKSIHYSKYRMRSYKMMKRSFEVLGLNSYKAIDINGKEIVSFQYNT